MEAVAHLFCLDLQNDTLADDGNRAHHRKGCASSVRAGAVRSAAPRASQGAAIHCLGSSLGSSARTLSKISNQPLKTQRWNWPQPPDR